MNEPRMNPKLAFKVQQYVRKARNIGWQPSVAVSEDGFRATITTVNPGNVEQQVVITFTYNKENATVTFEQGQVDSVQRVRKLRNAKAVFEYMKAS